MHGAWFKENKAARTEDGPKSNSGKQLDSDLDRISAVEQRQRQYSRRGLCSDLALRLCLLSLWRALITPASLGAASRTNLLW